MSNRTPEQGAPRLAEGQVCSVPGSQGSRQWQLGSGRNPDQLIGILAGRSPVPGTGPWTQMVALFPVK